MQLLKEWKTHIIQQKLSLGIRDKHFENNVVFSNSVLYRDRQYLYKSYLNHVMDKVKRHFPNMKMIRVHVFRKTNASLLFESGASIKVTQTKQNEIAKKFSRYMGF